MYENVWLWFFFIGLMVLIAAFVAYAAGSVSLWPAILAIIALLVLSMAIVILIFLYAKACV